MDKSSFETFEYLPATENNADQFYVVQDDGTFLSVNRQIQYVTQVQDVKEVLENVEPCTVYDVSNQQYFLDVDNTAEFISVSDQFIIPEGESNIFTSNYLLPVPNTTDEQIQKQDAVDEYQESKIQVDTEVESLSPNQISNCTEITLNDGQYQTLEQKGWLLLETNEKVFVLDTLGLHDITTNEKLIQKLKVEDQSNNENIDTDETSLPAQQDSMQFVINEDGIKLTEEIIQGHGPVLSNVQQDETADVLKTDTIPKDIAEPRDDKDLLNSINDDALKPTAGNTFKIKTDIIFKDIPKKIVLGETASGKKLFAKIKRIDSNNGSTEIDEPPRSNPKQTHRKQKNIINNQNVQDVPCNNASLNERFETLIRLALQHNSDEKCTAEHVVSANNIVTQLLKVPAFKTSILQRNLIITKEVSNQGEKGAFRSGGVPFLVTGHVMALDEDRYRFVHQPGMLQRLINNTDNYIPPLKKGVSQTEQTNFDHKNILHVHVTEMKRADNVLRISITLNKRQIPNDINVTLNNKRKLPSKIFGCSACAAVFQTEKELKDHQETQCMDVEDVLTIDTERNSKGYTVEMNGKEKIYSCNRCKSKFTKLYNCLKHFKTHFDCKGEFNVDDKISETNEEHKDGIYKCKMCSSTYFHPSTLSKHIVTKHIRVSTN